MGLKSLWATLEASCGRLPVRSQCNVSGRGASMIISSTAAKSSPRVDWPLTRATLSPSLTFPDSSTGPGRPSNSVNAVTSTPSPSAASCSIIPSRASSKVVLKATVACPESSIACSCATSSPAGSGKSAASSAYIASCCRSSGAANHTLASPSRWYPSGPQRHSEQSARRIAPAAGGVTRYDSATLSTSFTSSTTHHHSCGTASHPHAPSGAVSAAGSAAVPAAAVVTVPLSAAPSAASAEALLLRGTWRSASSPARSTRRPHRLSRREKQRGQRSMPALMPPVSTHRPPSTPSASEEVGSHNEVISDMPSAR
mmetsp:Transcript_6484/g.19248  ORF Transcript_6484/g.19248 Transcript_6484/m.19248 type:complete len:313 (-) Transcript_6484:8-946(-)